MTENSPKEDTKRKWIGKEKGVNQKGEVKEQENLLREGICQMYFERTLQI